MSDDEIQEIVRAFVRRYVKTIGHLELLLFLFDGRERSWTIRELNEELRSNEDLTAKQLADLASFVRVTELEAKRFQFVLGNLDMTETVRKVSELHRTKRHALFSLIYDKQLSAISDLADAFVLEKKKK